MREDEIARRMSEAADSEDADEEARRRSVLRKRLFGQAPDTRIGRFVLDERLGAGAMGTVYRAHDAVLDRPVAIKVLRGGRSEQASKRLLREARGLARLTHPNVVTVYEVGEVDGQPWIAMEFVPGATLGEWQAGRDSPTCVEAYLDAARGLAAVHGAGLVHRDFKPANVLVGEDGRVRVADFGLVRRDDATHTPTPRTTSASDADLTASGSVLGTPAYMAPEQLEGAVADFRSDQFSFCVALYEAVSGRRPYAGTTAQDLLADIRVGPPTTSHLPGWLGRALSRGLAVDPAARWADMDALIDALSPRRRSRVWLGVGLVASLLTAAGLWMLSEPAPVGDPVALAAIARARTDLQVDPTTVALALAELDPTTPGWSEVARRALTLPLTRRTLRPSILVVWMSFDDEGRLLGGTGDGWVRFEGDREIPLEAWGLQLAQFGVPAKDASREFARALRGALKAYRSEDGTIYTVHADALVEASPDGRVVRRPRPAPGEAMPGPSGRGLVLIPPNGPAEWAPSDPTASRVTLAKDVTVATMNDTGLTMAQRDGTVVVWDGRERVELVGLPGPVSTLAASRDGRWVVAVALGTARAWPRANPADGFDLPGRAGHRPPVFAGRDEVVVCDGRRGAIRFNLRSRRAVPLRGHTREVLVAGYRGNQLATSGSDRRIRWWDLSGVDGELLGSHDAQVWSGSIGPAGRRLATAGFDGAVRVFDLRGEDPPRVLRGHTARGVYHTAFSPDGRLLASGSADETARLWNLEAPDAPPLVFPGHSGWAYALAFSPDGRWLATGDRAGQVRVFPTDGSGPGRLLATHPTPRLSMRIHTLTFTADGRSVASAAKNGTVFVWPLDGSDPVQLPIEGYNPVISRLTSGLLLTLSERGAAHVWTPGGDLLTTWKYDSPAIGWTSQVSPRPNVALAYADGSVRVWSQDRSTPVWHLPRGNATYEQLRFDASGQRLALGDTDGRILVFSLPETTPRWRFEGHAGNVRFLAFDGDDVVSASTDGTVRRWATPTRPEAMRRLLTERTHDCLAADLRQRWLGETEAESTTAEAACRAR